MYIFYRPVGAQPGRHNPAGCLLPALVQFVSSRTAGGRQDGTPARVRKDHILSAVGAGRRSSGGANFMKDSRSSTCLSP